MKVQKNLFHIICVILVYWIMAISMVFINKRLISHPYVTKDMSVFFAWAQNIIAVLSVFAAYVVSKLLGFDWMGPVVDIPSLTSVDMVLASVTFTASMIFNNLMLKYISVAFYQVARCLTLVFVITFSVVFLRENVTTKTVMACMFIVCGFYISVEEELVSQGILPIGILYGVLASLFVGFCGVFFKRAQTREKIGSFQMAFNNSIICSLTLTPLVFSTSQLQDYVNLSKAVTSVQLWCLLVASGVMSLTIGWVSALQIQLTSPLTHHISINAKSVFQTMLAVFWSGQSRYLVWWVGNAVVIAGIAIYTVSKLSAAQKPAQDMEMIVREPKYASSSSSLMKTYKKRDEDQA